MKPAHRHHTGRVLEFLAQVVVLDGRQENVLGARRETVRHAGQMRHEPRHRRGVARERRMQMLDALGADFFGQQQRLENVARVRVAHVAEALPEIRVPAAGGLQRLPEMRGGHRQLHRVLRRTRCAS